MPRQSGQSAGLRNLVAQQLSRQLLGAVDKPPELVQVARSQRVPARADEAAFRHEVVEALAELIGTERIAVRTSQVTPQSIGGCRIAGEDVGQVDLLSTRSLPPLLHYCADPSGGPIVQLLCRPCLLRHHATVPNDEPDFGGQGYAPLEAGGTVAELSEPPGLRAENGGVVLAAAKGADAAVPGQIAEALPVLDGPQVGGQIQPPLPKLSSVKLGRAQFVDRRQDEKSAHDEGAGAAHAGRGREVAGKGQVHAQPTLGEVARQPASHRHRVVGPVSEPYLQTRVEVEADRLRRTVESANADRAILARHGHQAEALLERGHDAAAPGIVGVLAEHLDAARHEKSSRADGIIARRRRRQLPSRRGEEAGLGVCCPATQSPVHEQTLDGGGVEQLPQFHPRGPFRSPRTCFSAVTADKRIWVGIPRTNGDVGRRPDPSQMDGATGQLLGHPLHVGLAGQVQNRGSKGEHAELLAHLVDGVLHGIGNLQLAAHRRLNRRAGGEYARIEAPAVHAHSYRVGQSLDVFRIRLLDDASQLAGLIRLHHGEPGDSLRWDIAVREHAPTLEHRQPRTSEPSECAQGLYRIVVVGVDHKKRIIAGKPLRGGHGVGRPLRLDLQSEIHAQALVRQGAAVILAQDFVLGSHDQTDLSISGVGQGREHVVEKGPVYRHQGLYPGGGHRLLIIAKRGAIRFPHSPSKAPCQNNGLLQFLSPLISYGFSCFSVLFNVLQLTGWSNATYRLYL